MESIKELRKVCYPESKASTERRMPYLRFFTRRFSIYFTKFFLKIGLTANQVTFIDFLLNIFLCFLFIRGGRLSFLLAAILLQFWIILDCSDGEVARYRGGSKEGSTVDALGADFCYTTLFLSIGLGLFRGQEIYFLSGWPAFYFLIFGFAASLAKIGTRLVQARFGQVFARNNLAKVNLGDVSSAQKQSPMDYLQKAFTALDFQINNQAGFLFLIILAGAVFRWLDVLLIFYAFFLTFILALVVVSGFRQMKINKLI